MEPIIGIEPTDLSHPYGITPDDEPAPAMLDLRGHNGVSLGLPYVDLISVTLHPAEGMTLEFRHHGVKVVGRNLRPVYDQVLRHRLAFVQEQDFDAAPETATFVDSISVEIRGLTAEV